MAVPPERVGAGAGQGEGLVDESGSSPLSTPRRSPELSSVSPDGAKNPLAHSAAAAAPVYSPTSIVVGGGPGLASFANGHHHNAGPLSLAPPNATSTAAPPKPTADKPKKPRAPRKLKDETTASGDSSVKEKKPRKPRDPNKPPVKKRQKIADAPAPVPANGVPLNPFALMSSRPPSNPQLQPYPPPPPQPQVTAPRYVHPDIRDPPQNANPGAIFSGAPLPPQASRPSSSGQMYDPIRSSSSQVPTPTPTYNTPGPSPIKNIVNHARASPSIASLIDPPTTGSSGNSPSTLPISRLPSNGYENGISYPNIPLTLTPRPSSASSPHQGLNSKPTTLDGTMDIDAHPVSKIAPEPPKAETPAVPLPVKPPRAKEIAPPLPLGSGLLSSALFGGAETTPKTFEEVPNQCIVIDVSMKQGQVNYVNFMKEVEQKYGWDVAHPRQAEHRRRMKQMAAAGAAIESGSGSADELGVGISADEDSNAEAPGGDNAANNDSTAADGKDGVKKRRKHKGNEYDKTDDFIDDAEMIWEEQALASRDGYFVWSGPLARDGEKQVVERADGTVRRGRGRGRGRGSGASRGETSGRGGGPGSRGGRGSRGGATVRRPRITAAERALREQAKADKLAAAGVAAAPPNAPAAPYSNPGSMPPAP